MYDHDFAIYCKSFRDDFERLAFMLESAVIEGVSIPLLLSVPAGDMSLLRAEIDLPSFVQVIEDESYVIPGNPFPYGWLQQQICKLSVYNTNFSKTYAMIDSDTYFVNGCNSIGSDGDKYKIVASEVFTKYFQGNRRLVEYILNDSITVPEIRSLNCESGSEERLTTLAERVDELAKKPPDERGSLINGIFDVPHLALQPSQFFHSAILAEFSEYLRTLNMDFYDCIRISPWEYNWYACYALSQWSKDVIGVCSPIIHFASEADIMHAKASGIDSSKIKNRFCGIQMAARHFDRCEFGD